MECDVAVRVAVFHVYLHGTEGVLEAQVHISVVGPAVLAASHGVNHVGNRGIVNLEVLEGYAVSGLGDVVVALLSRGVGVAVSVADAVVVRRESVEIQVTFHGPIPGVGAPCADVVGLVTVNLYIVHEFLIAKESVASESFQGVERTGVGELAHPFSVLGVIVTGTGFSVKGAFGNRRRICRELDLVAGDGHATLRAPGSVVGRACRECDSGTDNEIWYKRLIHLC